MIARLALGTLVAFTLALLALPQPVAAAYPCPGGPGPGEVQVGVSGGSHGVAATPMCESAGGGGTGGGGGVYYIYGAVAWHPDVDDVWMRGGEAGSQYAEARALDECNRAMGGGCTSIGEWNNSSMTIIRDSGGLLYYGWDGQGGAARERSLAKCSSQQLLPCEVLHSFDSGKRSYNPNLAAARKLYATAAWVFGEGYDHRLYIASGHRNYAAADAAALAACAAATGRTCRIAATVGNGVIQPFKANSDTSIVAERNARRAVQAAHGDCKRRASTCAVQRAFDSRTAGNFVHDYNMPPR